MLRCFVDDSGRDPSDPALVLGAWCGTVDAMERFSDDWSATLAQSPAIDYYKHSEAVGRKGCFEGFAVQEATGKTTDMARVLNRHPLYGFVVSVNHSDYRRFVKDRAISKRTKWDRRMANPFYLLFSELVPLVLGVHYHAGIHGAVDFVFDGDKTDHALGQSTRMYEKLKADYEDHPWRQLMGTIVPGDDKDLMPLQAADLLAGQIRRSQVANSMPAVLKIWESSVRILCHNIVQKDLEKFVGTYNIGLATDTLSRIKNERERENVTQQTIKRVRGLRQYNAGTVSSAKKRTAKGTSKRRASKSAKKKAAS